MKPKISLITLGVNDVKSSLEFYQKLGFMAPSYKDGDDMVMFQLEGTWLGLYPKVELAKDATVPAEGSGFPGFTIAHNEPSKAEVDTTMKLFLDAGAKLVKPAHDTFWGGYSGYVADPDGYLWEIAWNPFTDLT